MESKFSKSTDSEHEIKLDSSLIYATWRCGVAYGGQTASFEVLTSFVGNGAKIKATGKSEKGKNLGKVSDKIKNNKYVGEFEIPEDIELGDEVYFEVELPDNSLSGESDRIPARPPVRVSNMKWSAKEARRGDVLTLTANVQNVQNGTEVEITIYEYDRDSIHDKIAKLPAVVQDEKIEVKWDYEYYEDTDEVPTEEELQKYGRNYNPPEYFFTIKIGETEFGKDQESGILEFKDWIELELLNYTGDEEYVLHLPDGTQRKGQFDDTGKLREEDLPPGRCTIEVVSKQQQQQTQQE